MNDTVKLVEALAWPIAGIIIAIAAVIIVRIVVGASGDLTFNIKDWFKIDRKHQSQETIPIIDSSALDDATGQAATTADTVAEVTEETKKPNSNLFWIDDNAATLVDSFTAFQSSDSYKSDPDFWHSLYIDRRRELGIGDEESELRSLADANQTWVWPLVFLIRRYIRLHDAVRAESALSEALARQHSDRMRWVLREGIALYYNLFGLDRAMEFCRSRLLAGATDAEISAMFHKTIELYGDDDDVFSRALLREIHTNYDPADKNSLFRLAFSYGTVRGFSVIAYQRYAKLGTTDKDWQSSPNNMGVVIQSTSESLQNEYYEKALALGSGVAASNLACSLIGHGYITRAANILDSVSDDANGGADSTHLADARSKLAAARDKMEKEQRSFDNFAREQDKRYKAVIFSALDYFKASGLVAAEGAFVSDDKTIGVVLDREGANCAYRLGENVLSGRLLKKPLCFEGSVSKIGSGILDYTHRRILCTQVAGDTLRLVVWPQDAKQSDPLIVVDLQRFSRASQLKLSEPGDVLLAAAVPEDESKPGASDGITEA